MIKRPFLFPFLFLALAALSGCVPDMQGMFGANYKPLTAEVAQIATPASPPPPPAAPMLYCRAGKGSAFYKSKNDWYDFAETAFSLRQGDRVNTDLPRDGHAADVVTIQSYFDDAGQKLIFCPVIVNAPPEQAVPCASIYALEDDLRMGIKRTFDIPGAIRGGQITCAYDPKKLRSLATPKAGGG